MQVVDDYSSVKQEQNMLYKSCCKNDEAYKSTACGRGATNIKRQHEVEVNVKVTL